VLPRSISSVATASAPSQQQQQATAVSRDDERSMGAFLLKLFQHDHSKRNLSTTSQPILQMKELGVIHP